MQVGTMTPAPVGGMPQSGGAAGSPSRDVDAGVPTPVEVDAGSTPLSGSGSCCSAHDTPGCGNADLQVCVCEKLPECCTKAWTDACVFIVAQKYCQAGVRDCVCGTGTAQWGQTQCCESQWSASCDSVAELKCNAVAGCF
jgi:hypothetical protein